MRGTPRESTESLSENYEELMQESMAVHGEFEAVADAIDARLLEGQHGAAEQLLHTRHGFDGELNALQEERAALMRKLENLQTIDDAFPRVNATTKASTPDVNAAASLFQFFAGSRSKAELRAAAGRIVGPAPGEALSEEEWKQFRAARAALGRQLGYAVGYEGKTDDEAGDWFRLERNGLSFEMKHSAFPSGVGIMGNSRISALHVTSRGRGSMEKFTSHLRFDGTWEAAPIDPVVQREIDRAIAIFG